MARCSSRSARVDLLPSDVLETILDHAVEFGWNAACVPAVSRAWWHAFERLRKTAVEDASSLPEAVARAKHGTTLDLSSSALWLIPRTVVVRNKAVRIICHRPNGCVVAVRGNCNESVISVQGHESHLHLENLTLLGGSLFSHHAQRPVGVVDVLSGFYCRCVMVRCTLSPDRSFVLQRVRSFVLQRTLLGMVSAQHSTLLDIGVPFRRSRMFGLIAGDHAQLTLSRCIFVGGYLPLLHADERTNVCLRDCCFLGAKAQAIKLRNSSMSMQRSVVAYGFSDGICISGARVELDMHECSIVRNAEYGIAADLVFAPAVHRILEDNRVEGNGCGPFWAHVVT